MGNNIIELKDLIKVYSQGQSNEVYALNEINFTVKKGEFVAIVGESGSGKSTMMNIIGLVDDFTSGQYIFDDINVKDLSDNEKCDMRNKKIGFIFQNFNLISRMSAYKNVELPMKIAGEKKTIRRKKTKELLDLVGLENRKNHLPSQLSGGQNQRVAIARALANDPLLILADEPTGALDSVTSENIIKVLKKLNGKGKTIVLITHSMEAARQADRIVEINDGRIVKS